MFTIASQINPSRNEASHSRPENKILTYIPLTLQSKRNKLNPDIPCFRGENPQESNSRCNFKLTARNSSLTTRITDYVSYKFVIQNRAQNRNIPD